jgi:hypothetical protein
MSAALHWESGSVVNDESRANSRGSGLDALHLLGVKHVLANLVVCLLFVHKGLYHISHGTLCCG